ncbi:threonine-phosphate decarboxylase [Salinarimonas ramus]|uniref:threonine-phosphate decarboxylase n=1 Tax=Salinarimonas ramus TaxID=690164 RepID=A0A917Q3V5_9HYPH|nr:threonine-phosphate decarboxylase [Salinarimonas ramus]
MSERIWHGGDLGEARALFPHAPAPWIDLSTGINPIAYPLPALPASAFTRLPEPAEHAALEEAAARVYGGADPALVVAAPGTQVLISLLPFVVPARDVAREVAIVGPTYGEHARAWAAAGADVRMVAGLEEAERADVIVVVNPNNPDGRLLSRAALRSVAAGCATRGGLLVIDEAFADLDDAESLAADPPEGAIVLRSFGKTWGLAGIRLGFALARGTLAERLRAALGPWSVSGPALAIGRAALSDAAWLAQTRRARAGDAARLDRLLAPHADGDVRGTTLFRTIRTDAAPDLFRRLGEAGIWVRRFQDDPRRLRFGLPGGEGEWERLGVVLR